MRQAFGVLALMAPLVLVGCGGGDSAHSSGKNATGPTENTGRKASSDTTAPEATGRLATDTSKGATGGAGAITPENTKIEFVGSKKDGKHDGGFKSFSGSIKPADGDVTKATISVEINTDSIWTDDDGKLNKLTAHLKGPDFFDVKKYPKATFVSKEIKAEKKGEDTHVITGDLTLHGTTKSVTVPAKVTETADTLTLDATFPIDRTDYGINFNPAMVNKEVTIKVSSKVARK